MHSTHKAASYRQGFCPSAEEYQTCTLHRKCLRPCPTCCSRRQAAYSRGKEKVSIGNYGYILKIKPAFTGNGYERGESESCYGSNETREHTATRSLGPTCIDDGMRRGGSRGFVANGRGMAPMGSRSGPCLGMALDCLTAGQEKRLLRR